MSPRRHHIVPAGYQRHFADGELIQLWDKRDGTSKVVGVKDNFVKRGFNSVYSSDPSTLESMEDEWARLERAVLPAIPALVSGERSKDVTAAVKALFAMLFCRSYTHLEHSSRIIELQRSQAAEYESRLRDAFIRDFGRRPQSGEIERRVREHIDTLEESRVQFVQGMVRIYQQLIRIFEPFHLQVAEARVKSIGLITGDTPVVVASGLKVGTLEGVGIANCDLRYMPVSRWMAVSLGPEASADRWMAPSDVQRMNHLMWKNSIRFLAAHPSEDVLQALARRSWPASP